MDTVAVMDRIIFCGFNGFKQIENVLFVIKSFWDANCENFECSTNAPVAVSHFQDVGDHHDDTELGLCSPVCTCNKTDSDEKNSLKRPYIAAFSQHHTPTMTEAAARKSTSTGQGASLQRLWTLPNGVRLDHAEITWSRIGLTFICKVPDTNQERYQTIISRLPAPRDMSINTPMQKPVVHLDNCRLQASSQSGFLLRCQDQLQLVPMHSDCAVALSLVKGDPEHADSVQKIVFKAETEFRPHSVDNDGVGAQGDDPNSHGKKQTSSEPEVSEPSSDSVCTFSAMSGTATQFLASYDGISVGKLNVNSKTKDCDPHHNHEEKEHETRTQQLVLTCLDSGLSVTHISCGLEHSLFLTRYGTVLSCGSGSRGQLGHGSLEEEVTPRVLSALEGLRFVHISAGGWHSAAVSECGDLYAWGWNESGQLGLPSPGVQQSSEYWRQVKTMAKAAVHLWPQNVPVGSLQDQEVAVKTVASGSRHMAVLTENGEVYTTGWNKYYQLGHPHSSSLDHLTHVELPSSGLKVTNVFCGAWNMILVLSKEKETRVPKTDLETQPDVRT